MMLIVTRAVIMFLCSPHEPQPGVSGEGGGERGVRRRKRRRREEKVRKVLCG